METLLDDYKHKLATVEEFIKNNKNNGSIHDEKRAERLTTKASEYRVFIVDIERAIQRMKKLALNCGGTGYANYPHQVVLSSGTYIICEVNNGILNSMTIKSTIKQK